MITLEPSLKCGCPLALMFYVHINHTLLNGISRILLFKSESKQVKLKDIGRMQIFGHWRIEPEL